MAKEIIKADAKTEKVAKVVRRKPARKTILALTNGAKRAAKELADLPTTQAIEADALAGIALAKALCGTKLHNEGKLSPLGHMAGKQNGLLDVAILTCDTPDFATWVKAVARANPPSRKTDVDNNKGLIKRLQSHMRSISGRKATGMRDFPKRLAKVGLGAKAEEIMGAFAPVSLLFDEYVAAGKF